MLRINVAGYTLGVSFRHPFVMVQIPAKGAIKGVPILTPRRATICEIFEFGEKSVRRLANGVVRCYYLDTFSKASGRKKALALALKEAGFNRAEREKIWIAYHNRGVQK